MLMDRLQQNLQNSGLNDPLQNILAKTHLGATGNLGLDSIKIELMN